MLLLLLYGEIRFCCALVLQLRSLLRLLLQQLLSVKVLLHFSDALLLLSCLLVQALQKLFTYGLHTPSVVHSSPLRRPARRSVCSVSGSEQNDEAAVRTSGTAASGLGPVPGPGSFQELGPAAQRSGQYVPPHLRAQMQHLSVSSSVSSIVPAGQQPVAAAHSSSTLRFDSSDSEASDSDGGWGGPGPGPADCHKSSRARLAALQCVQALARTDSRALHPFWTSLLPLHDAVAKQR